jgi:hypothetical protein
VPGRRTPGTGLCSELLPSLCSAHPWPRLPGVRLCFSLVELLALRSSLLPSAAPLFLSTARSSSRSSQPNSPCVALPSMQRGVCPSALSSLSSPKNLHARHSWCPTSSYRPSCAVTPPCSSSLIHVVSTTCSSAPTIYLPITR